MITVLLPSRGRPRGAYEAVQSFYDTVTLPATRLILLLSEDDPELDKYFNLAEKWSILPAQYNTLSKKLNRGAQDFQSEIIGFVADDNRFRTSGWDETIAGVLNTPGIAYGNDLFHGQGLPTSVFMTQDIYNALGWFALPTCDHLYLDNAWRTLGERLGRLTYLPNVIIEHMHPVAGKGEFDATYALSNTSERMSQDGQAFFDWERNGSFLDIERVRRDLGL